MTIRSFVLGLTCCLLGCFGMLVGASSIDVMPSTTEQKAMGLANYNMVFTEVPKNRPLFLFTKRLVQKDPDEWVFAEELSIDDEGHIIINERPGLYYGLHALGYLPGEEVSYCLCLQDGTPLAQTSYYPRPLAKKSKSGDLTIKATLLGLLPLTQYMLNIEGLQKGETFTFSSISGTEQISHDHVYDNAPIMLTPGVVGMAGGEAWVKITRQSREYVLIRLPWGDALIKPLVAEVKKGVESPEFTKYSG